MKLHKYIQKLVEINKQEVALTILKEKSDDLDEQNDLVLIYSNWNRLKRKMATGMISEADYEQEQTKISNSILAFLHFLDDLPLDDTIKILEEDKFLCVAHDSESAEFLAKFFNAPPFKLFDVCQLEECKQLIAENKYTFVVFDNNDGNTDKEKLKEREALMAECLEAMNCPILIHYGSQFIDLVRLQPNRVVSANSVFTLHSRVKDVLSYLGLNLQQI
jgi:Mg2+ and Co2+ transporter CorA